MSEKMTPAIYKSWVQHNLHKLLHRNNDTTKKDLIERLQRVAKELAMIEVVDSTQVAKTNIEPTIEPI